MSRGAEGDADIMAVIEENIGGEWVPVTREGKAATALFLTFGLDLKVEEDEPELGMWLVELPDHATQALIELGRVTWSNVTNPNEFRIVAEWGD